MIQLQEDATPALPARRVSAEEFCALARQSGGSVYRPRWEVLRMLAVGEAWGTCAADSTLKTVLMVLPLEADVSLAAGMRALMGTRPERTFLLTPPAGDVAYLPGVLKAAKTAAFRRSPPSPIQAVAERLTPEVLEAYFDAGFSLRALRPVHTMVPFALFSSAPVNTNRQEVCVPLEDATHLALLLARGWTAVSGKAEENGYMLRLMPLHG
jgi:hypothetical protein